MKKFTLVLVLIVSFFSLVLVGCTPQEKEPEETWTFVVTEPTCTEQGFTTHTSNLGNVKKDTYIDVLDHAWGDLIVDVAATEDSEGTGHKVCSVGGETKTEVIPAITYVWKTVSTEANADAFVFDKESEELTAINANGLEELWVNMFAINYNAVDATDSYTVEATFTPSGDNNSRGSERTYGLVAWYQNADNFLIYWLQQKDSGNWSGQFYGKVNGENRNYTKASDATAWNTSEWDDMWWDGGTAHPALRNVSQVLLTTEVTLKVVSKIVDLGELGFARSFELHQIVAGEDHLASTFYVKDAPTVAGKIRTGVYANNFDMEISDFSLQEGLWETIAVEANTDAFVYDEISGDITEINANGLSDMWLNMYSIYNVPVNGNYEVNATFTPIGENNVKGAERTYGLVAWYQNADNFLIYWLQQKDGGNWSGQFYGKFNGVVRNYVRSLDAAAWNTSEWDDMWWDGDTAHADLKSVSHVLLTTEVTIKVVSKVVELDTLGTARSFELYQVVEGVEHLSATFYVKDIASVEGEVYTGVYANNFDLAIKFK